MYVRLVEAVGHVDKLFISAFWTALHKLTGVKLKLSTSYHPETDGASERTNKTLVQALRYHVARNQSGWVRALPRVRFELMNTLNPSTGFSRFQLHLGRSPRLVPPIIPRTDNSAPMVNADTLVRQLESDTFEARDNLLLAKLSQATSANAHRGADPAFEVGERVMLSTFHRRREYTETSTSEPLVAQAIPDIPPCYRARRRLLLCPATHYPRDERNSYSQATFHGALSASRAEP